MLIGLLPEKIRLQIWNTKDKLCSQARYERLRAIRLSQELSEDEMECGEHLFQVVIKMIKLFTPIQQKKRFSREALRFPLLTSVK